MNIQIATLSELNEIYNNHMIYDFPDNERRPLEHIHYLISKKQYIPYLLVDQNTIIGYAFFYGTHNDYICDYFAILKKYRNHNYGSQFLKQCLHLFQDKTLYFEVEKPEAPDYDIKKKRIDFYLKNGLLLSHHEIRLYFVDYLILSNKNISINDIQNIYHHLYDKPFFDKYIEIKK